MRLVDDYDLGFDGDVVHDGDVQECFKGLVDAGLAKLLHQVAYTIRVADVLYRGLGANRSGTGRNEDAMRRRHSRQHGDDSTQVQRKARVG